MQARQLLFLFSPDDSEMRPMDAGHLKLLDQEENAVTHFPSSGRLRNVQSRAIRCVRWFFFPARFPGYLPGSVSGVMFLVFCFWCFFLNCVPGPAASMPPPGSLK